MMDATPRVSTVTFDRSLHGGWVLGVVGKRTFTVSHGQCGAALRQVALVETPRLTDDGRGVAHDCDLLLERAQVDIIVAGYAQALDVRTEFEASVRVGELERRLLVVGDRRVERGAAGRLRFTPPEPVTRVSLAWDVAYGGLDAPAWARYGQPRLAARGGARPTSDPRFTVYGYPRNPFGRGYLIEPSDEGLRACRLPNLEDPATRLSPENLVCEYARRWPHMPPVACTGWLSYNAFPRALYLGLLPGPYDLKVVLPDDFFEVRAGWVRPEAVSPTTSVASRVDARLRQSAAMGMRAAQVSPGAQVSLTHMHPRERAWRFQLPREAPRMVVRLPGADPVELTPGIRTVLLEPEDDRVCLVWSGELRLDAPLSPEQLARVEHAVAWNDAPRPA